ncbi:SUMF1/EgtB/PvdO family nonheme iron enzyme [Asanoa sp. NPDC049573]|uniref:nSTAND1 domain-containing NTPase n=1 Tax=Asanoa sp. NPDC049573 TaxID=3155396 RepID=UPI00341DDCAF
MPDVAQFFATELGDVELRREVRAFYNEAAQKVAAVPPVLRAIAELPGSVIATTNVDGMLDRVLGAGSFDSIVGNTDVAYHELMRKLVVPLHGKLERPESLTLTRDDHYNFVERYELLDEVLRAHLVLRTPILIGCDLQDPFLAPFYRRVAKGMGEHARRAYAIQSTIPPHEEKYWRTQNLVVVREDPASFLESIRTMVGAGRNPANGGVASEPSVQRQIFKFLAPFEETDAERFFGRRVEVDAVMQKIASRSFVVLHSRSGAGKTSLIRAGLIPNLVRQQYRAVYLTAWRDPIAQLAEVLAANRNGGRAALRRRVSDELVRLSSAGTHVVIFIDQFEQFFLSTNITEQQRADLTALLEDCVSGRLANVRFVVSVREDFLADLHDLQQTLRTTFANYYRLGNLSSVQAREAIEGPLGLAGIKAPSALVEQILDELQQGAGQIFPPQLQIVCDRLFSQERDAGWVATQVPGDLEALGGVRGILANYVSDVLRSMTAVERSGAQTVLKALVSSRKTRSKVGLEILAARTEGAVDLRHVLEALEDHRLIRRDDEAGALHFELTHEYMIDEISSWITEDEYNTRRAQELVEREFFNWMEDPTVHMTVERFAFINGERSALQLTLRQREFLLTTSLNVQSDIGYWLDQVDLGAAEIQDRLATDLASPSAGQRRNAAVLLLVHGARSSNDRLLSEVLAVLAAVGNPRTLELLSEVPISGGIREEVARVVRERYRSGMASVEAGPFVMGSTPAEIDWVSGHFDIPRGWIEKEMPQSRINLETYLIDRHLTTNGEFVEFDPSHRFPAGQDDHPVVNVTWRQAGDYAAWVGKRLPTEAEWEKAARGVDGRRYPWGDQFDVQLANSKESGIGTTTPVGSFPEGASPYGCLDMAGNVFEWTSTLAAPYPYEVDDREDPDRAGVRILRGGAFSYNYSLLRCALRYDYYDPTHASTSLGFRCAA